MPTTIADLACFARIDAEGYRARTDALLDEYRLDRATEMESDCHDQWARLRFHDGSELIVTDTEARADNRHAVDWSQPDAMRQAMAIADSLRPH